MSAVSSSKTCVKTFAIFDLETTGLDTKSERITEFAIVAVTREDFLNSLRKDGGRTFPRILSKISVVVNPDFPIQPAAARVSRLTSDMLADQKDFRSAFESISPFLARLPSPVCLIAHNGNRFDFPLLKAELHRNDLSISHLDLYQFDTFVNLKSIDKKWLSDCTIRNGTTVANSPKSVPNSVAEPLVEINNQEKMENNNNGSVANNDQIIKPILSYSYTTDTSKIYWQSPTKHAVGSNLHITNFVEEKSRDVVYWREAESANSEREQEEENSNSSQSSVGFSEVPSLARTIIVNLTSVPGSYTQSNVYQRLFGEEPTNAHAAEGDCLSLLKIALCYGQSFVEAVDANATKFST